MLIWILFALITGICLVVVLMPLARSANSATDRSSFDAEVLRDQLKQLDRDEDAGTIGSEDAEGARLELSRRLLAAANEQHPRGKDASAASPRWALAGAAFIVPAISLALYILFGSPQLPNQPLAARQNAPVDQQSIETLILKVEKHLRENPDDARGWQVIAPAYVQQRRFRDAASAYARAIELKQRDPSVLTNYGEALVLAEQGLVTEQARSAFTEAAKRDSKQFKARFYLGLAERQDGKTETAIAMWEKILAEGSKDANWRPVIEAHIKLARESITDAPALSQEELDAADELSTDERNQMVEGMVSRLAERLEQDGNDLAGWLRLARSYVVLKRTEQASAALDKAQSHFSGDEKALSQIAEARKQLGLEQAETVADAPQPTAEDVEAAQSMTADERLEMIQGMVSRLAERLEEDGDDLEGWLRLVRSYIVLGDTEKARAALDKADARFAEDPAAKARIAGARKQFGLE